MENGEQQEVYRKFIEQFCAKINNLTPEEQEAPFRLTSLYLVPSEVEAECLEWIRRYLSLNDCPSGLLSQLTRAIFTNFDDCVQLSEYYTQAFDISSNNQDASDNSQDSSEDDIVGNIRPPQLDANKLLDAVISHVHATVKEWNTKPPVMLPSSCKLHVFSHAIKNTRRKMEDKHVVITDLNVLYDLKDHPPQSYFAVFDGHGGLDAAVYAATHLHAHLLADKLFLTDPAAAMKQAYKTTDIKFLEKSKRENLRSGTTGISVLLRGSEMLIGWLGDSQALLVRSGEPVQIMVPHKPEREDEKRRIEDLGGCVLFSGTWRVNGHMSVSRAIGDISQKPFISSDADVTSLQLTGDEEYLVIACDGLWDVLTPHQVTEIVYKHSLTSLDNVAVGLVNAARDSGSSDNISVIVVMFQTALCQPRTATDGATLLGLSSESSLSSSSFPKAQPLGEITRNSKSGPKDNSVGSIQYVQTMHVTLRQPIG
ncbi:protein phosphatase 1F-like [Physella acuta]|uniref:protein phosphatase 1F-like n=1 Tax=Physella acuta TaxID=109671 RepID=UPI0027DE171E|nr:protein phosphatase 1F-like [Physella acuta]